LFQNSFRPAGRASRRHGERWKAAASALLRSSHAQQNALNRIGALRERLDALRRAELSTYAEHLTRAITDKLGQLNLNVPVSVSIGIAPPGSHELRYGTTPLPGDSYCRIDEAIASAIAETPTPAALPGTPLERAER
jgi:hypothetical protein